MPRMHAPTLLPPPYHGTLVPLKMAAIFMLLHEQLPLQTIWFKFTRAYRCEILLN